METQVVAFAFFQGFTYSEVTPMFFDHHGMEGTLWAKACHFR